MREREIERALVRDCEAIGYRCLKLIGSNVVGFPDRTILGPNRVIAFVELKTKTGRQSELQKRWQQVLEGFGFPFFVARSVEDVRKLVKDISQ